MNNQDLFEKYLMTKNENKEQIQTPISASIQALEPNSFYSSFRTK